MSPQRYLIWSLKFDLWQFSLANNEERYLHNTNECFLAGYQPELCYCVGSGSSEREQLLCVQTVNRTTPHTAHVSVCVKWRISFRPVDTEQTPRDHRALKTRRLTAEEKVGGGSNQQAGAGGQRTDESKDPAEHQQNQAEGQQDDDGPVQACKHTASQSENRPETVQRVLRFYWRLNNKSAGVYATAERND